MKEEKFMAEKMCEEFMLLMYGCERVHAYVCIPRVGGMFELHRRNAIVQSELDVEFLVFCEKGRSLVCSLGRNDVALARCHVDDNVSVQKVK